ncbi:hypothetical protein Smp_133780 [Schistosoma mansoni]|nr:hypothetical protein Smp_133780 [Schistosoma mansoni]|eukprot:XP_018654554.1 hypothetical protein Smp_133780 [Schistosoma mansoni]
MITGNGIITEFTKLAKACEPQGETAALIRTTNNRRNIQRSNNIVNKLP